MFFLVKCSMNMINIDILFYFNYDNELWDVLDEEKLKSNELFLKYVWNISSILLRQENTRKLDFQEI